ncbi:nuclear transport factor 2 family protein [Streptomyces sp. NPDC059909]|uniref:nuclear transport factor 2 family protein n=1 Tax=Streptomyces sp. NPDC059909 TaxID=3346998 RepID=UPI00365BE9BD
MHGSPDERAHEEVVDAYRAQLRAMTDGDTDALDVLLGDGLTLTHITGYVQPKAEWLSQMRAGRFVYHEVVQKNVTIEVEVDTARLIGRIVTDATVHGTHADRRLRLTMEYARESGTWSHSARSPRPGDRPYAWLRTASQGG